MDMSHLPALPPAPLEDDPDVATLDTELAALPEEDYDIEELEDGSAVLRRTPAEEAAESDFSDNLVGILPDGEVDAITRDLHELIQADKTSREQRDKQYAEGIKRTGLGGEAPGGAEFDGASKAVHPMLAKGSVDFASKAVKELYPANGPCKTHIIGESTEDKIDKAERKRLYMNWQMTTQVAENRAEFERLLSQVPLGGSQYKRWWWDANLKRPRTETVYVDDVFLPYNQADFYTSNRVTHRQWLSKSEYDARVASGLYSDTVLVPGNSQGMQDKSEARKASDKVEGAEEEYVAYNDEGLREMYQVYVDLAIEGDAESGGALAPYILHMSADNGGGNGKCVGLYRNWAEEDEKREKKHWMVEYTFIPWRGAYGIGLIHLIGSLAGGATGALRALLDSAHIQNFPGGLKLKGGRTAGQSIQVNATELAEIAAPPGVDDIRKLVMAFPFNGPSAVLFNLLEWLGQQAEATIATANEKIADAGANMPMGTALALIEQGSINFSAIHSRMHGSLKREMAILHRLNAENLTDEEVVEELGELVVYPEDFQGPMDIIPVSDPNIFSETQRYAQLQAVMQLRQDPVFGPLFKADKLLQRALKLLQVPSPEEIANLPKDPKKLGPLEENIAVSVEEPSPLKVYKEQDDVAHLQTHLQYMTSPIFGGSPMFGPQVLPVLVNHCKEHMLAVYTKNVTAAKTMVLEVAKRTGREEEFTPDRAAVAAAAFADKILAEVLGPMIMPAIQAAQKLMAQYAPKPPVSPDVAHAEANKLQIAQAGFAKDKELKGMELGYQEKRDQADREQNKEAANLAATVEQLKTATTQQISEFNGAIALMRDQTANDAKMLLVEMQAREDRLTQAIQAFLANMQFEQTKPTNIIMPESLDLGLQLKPLIEGTQSTAQMLSERLDALVAQTQANQQGTQQVLQSVVNSMLDLHKLNAAPRVAEYIMGPNGRPTGVRSTVQQQMIGAPDATDQ